jgi:hypothetical protein
MRALYYFYAAAAILIGLLIFDQIWLGIVSWDIAFKLLITLGLAAGVTLVVQLIRQELIQDRADRKDKFVD